MTQPLSTDAPPDVVPDAPPGDENDVSLVDVSSWLRESPPWLASALLHMLVVLLLGVVWVTSKVEQPLMLNVQYAEELGEQLLDEPLELDLEADLNIEEQAVAITTLPPVDDPLAAPDMPVTSPDGLTPTTLSDSLAPGAALTGREPGMKAVLLRAYGGTRSTEEAVDLGLEWLARQQKKNGLWSLQGAYKDGANVENIAAATAMALLAFQGRGHTHLDGEHKEFTRVVSRGWDKLLERQAEDGNFSRSDGWNHAFYTQAQCTIALCELYAMSQDKALRDPAQRAVDYLVKTQDKSGGWRYRFGEGADTSVTGWVVMALKSAQMAGLDVPSDTFYRIGLFLDSVARNEGSHYAYQRNDSPTRSMTAEGLLCRQYLGWSRNDERLRRGVQHLLREDNLPSWRRGQRDVYYWYYATQVCHHMEGDDWDRWNRRMRKIIPEQQVKSGRERGSWDLNIDEKHGRFGGRLYTTCLSIYILEVYYRHLPLYRQDLLSSF